MFKLLKGVLMKLKTMSFVWVIFIFFISINAFASIQSERSAYVFEVKNKVINLQAKDVSFKKILKDLQEKTGIKVNIYEGVQDKKVSLVLKSLPVLAIHTILQKMALQNSAVVYDNKRDVMAIYVLPKGQDLSIPAMGKTIIKNGNFLGGEGVDRIKGQNIVSISKGKHNVPIRYVEDEILLKFQRGVSTQEISDILLKYCLVEIDNKLSKIGYIKTKITDGRDVVSVIKEIRNEYHVKNPEPSFILNTLTISDPLYTEQWYIPGMGFDKAWTMTKNKNQVKVAMIDSGIDIDHPDLNGKLLKGFDFVNNDDDPSDDNGHGTFVAGIVAASSNMMGIKGLYDPALIIPIKVIDEHGLGTYDDVAKGILFAADHGANVINLSLGGYAYSFMLKDAVDYALEKGCIIIAAGGNDGIEQANYPAAYPDVIGVAASGYDDLIWSGSNRGKHIDVCAPGLNIISTALGGQYIRASGTSASASMVSALAAMLVSDKPGLSSSSIKQTIMQSAKDLGLVGWDKDYGHGMVAADAALMHDLEPFHDVAVRNVSIEPQVFEKGTSIYITVKIENIGTYKSEVCQVTLYAWNGEKKIDLGTKKIIDVADKATVVFESEPFGLDRHTQFEALCFSEKDTRLENNSKSTPFYSLREDQGLYVLHEVSPPVHQWIAGQAYDLLPSGTMKSEIFEYIGSQTTISVEGHSVPGYVESKQIIMGARDEDDGTNWLEHFWDEDAGPSAGGLDLFGLPPYDNAYQRAGDYWATSKSAYMANNKAEAYYQLGKIAHLLMDMSVPAHVLNDQHMTGDRYEVYMAEWDDDYSSRFNYHLWTSNGLVLIQGSSLLELFENLADTADNYESDDYDGEDPNHYEGHNGAGFYDTSYAECYNHGTILMPKAIQYVAGLYQRFWNETHIIEETDFDHDGLPDSWENDHFINLTIADNTTDTDNDGLLDKDEYTQATNPNDDDSDGDGDRDGDEVLYGSDPNEITDTLASHTPVKPVIEGISGLIPLRGHIFDVLEFQDPDQSDGDYLSASEWQISTSSLFDQSSIVLQRLLERQPHATNEAIEHRQLQVPQSLLERDTVYWIQTRHRDSKNLWSTWSTSVSFTTIYDDPDDADDNGIDDACQVIGFVDTNANDTDDHLENIHVLSDEESNGTIGIQASSGDLAGLDALARDEITPEQTPTDPMPYGLFSFRIDGLPVDATNPATVEMTFYFPEDLPSNTKWYKYDQCTNTMTDFSDHALIQGRRVILTLIDGGPGDVDGVVNGVIVDPSGVLVTQPGNDDDGGCFIGDAAHYF